MPLRASIKKATIHTHLSFMHYRGREPPLNTQSRAVLKEQWSLGRALSALIRLCCTSVQLLISKCLRQYKLEFLFSFHFTTICILWSDAPPPPCTLTYVTNTYQTDKSCMPWLTICCNNRIHNHITVDTRFQINASYTICLTQCPRKESWKQNACHSKQHLTNKQKKKKVHIRQPHSQRN